MIWTYKKIRQNKFFIQKVLDRSDNVSKNTLFVCPHTAQTLNSLNTDRI